MDFRLTTIGSGRPVAGRRRVRRFVLVATTAIALALLAGCGSDSDSEGDSGSTPGGGQTEVSNDQASQDAENAEMRVQPYLKTPTSIGLDVPLTEAPPTGLTIAYVNGNLPSQQNLNQYVKAAADALGWKTVFFTYDGADPTTIDKGVQQAVQQGVDYIAVEGVGSATFTAGLEAATKAGIPVVLNESSPEPDTGILGCVNCIESKDRAFDSLLYDWMIADSGGHADIVFVGIPEFTLNQFYEDFSPDYLKKYCAECSLDFLQQSVAALTGGQINGQIIAYLQSHPDVDYVNCWFGDVCGGLRSAMDSAGIGDDVKLVTLVPNPEQIQGIIDGSFQATIPNPALQVGYRMVDALARDSVGMDIAPAEDTATATMIWTNANPPSDANEADKFAGPDDSVDQFLALWGVN